MYRLVTTSPGLYLSPLITSKGGTKKYHFLWSFQKSLSSQANFLHLSSTPDNKYIR